jgi:2,4-dienoyl-CoA reductase-like NADH-dependent reductase (Old Yellow Enzyme family)
MADLFTPFTLRSVTMRNRIGVSPMCQYSAVAGRATDWHLVHLGARAVGGAGLVMAEATAVAPEGRITPGCTGLWEDGQIEPFARVVRFLEAHGAVPAIQLAHAGRKAGAARPWEGAQHLAPADGGWESIGPSAVAFGSNLPRVPRAMSLSDIQRVQRDFVAAARRARAAGFRLLEFHSAHGYLSHSFLSPLSNRRTDAYGGDFEGRTRFTLETAAALRAAWPEELPFAVRISCSDWMEGGWTIDESVELARRLRALGADLVDCSSSGSSPDAKPPYAPGWQVPFAERIRREAGVATAAVGLITEPVLAEEIVRTGKADLVFLARQMLREPYWPIRAARELGRPEAVKFPIQYGHYLKD